MPVYRLVLSLLTPGLLAMLVLRVLRGQETLRDLGARLGRAQGAAPDGPVIWLHAASVGEANSARPLIDALLERHGGLHLLVTANTVTGRDRVAGWALPRVHARLAPLDLRPCTARVLAHWQPRALVNMEGELWPNRFALARARGVPVAMLAARLSARAARRWARLPGLVRQIGGAVRLISAQDAASEARLRALGLPEAAFHPAVGLKAAAAGGQADPALLADLRRTYPRDDTLLAASTHEGEDAVILQAFAAARETAPHLRLILAPRHPARGTAVAALVRASGLSLAQRSTGALPGPDTAVYLADTLGEMPLWYTLAGRCFVGGSLVEKGGHTPYEPAAAGCAILHGPSRSNFEDAYATLARARAALQVADAQALRAAMLLPASTMRDMARRGTLALRETGDPATRLVDALSGLAELSLLRGPPQP